MKSSAQETAGWAIVGLAGIALLLLIFSLGLDAPPLRILFGWGAFLVVPALIAGGLGLASVSESNGACVGSPWYAPSCFCFACWA